MQSDNEPGYGPYHLCDINVYPNDNLLSHGITLDLVGCQVDPATTVKWARMFNVVRRDA